jgi:hypothetical protein
MTAPILQHAVLWHVENGACEDAGCPSPTNWFDPANYNVKSIVYTDMPQLVEFMSD